MGLGLGLEGRPPWAEPRPKAGGGEEKKRRREKEGGGLKTPCLLSVRRRQTQDYGEGSSKPCLWGLTFLSLLLLCVLKP